MTWFSATESPSPTMRRPTRPLTCALTMRSLVVTTPVSTRSAGPARLTSSQPAVEAAAMMTRAIVSLRDIGRVLERVGLNTRIKRSFQSVNDELIGCVWGQTPDGSFHCLGNGMIRQESDPNRSGLFRPIRLDLPEIPDPRLPAILRPISAPQEMIGRNRAVANARDQRVRARPVRLHHKPIAAVAPRCPGCPRSALFRAGPGDLPGLPRRVVHAIRER